MAVGQAFAVAFGLTFVILGGLYVVFRSGLAAQRQRENPAVPQSTIWLIADRGLTVLLVALLLYVGTFLLIHPSPNVFFAAGVATSVYGQALLKAFGLKPWVLRATWSAYVLAGLLCGVGAALHGGPVGIFGVTLSLVFSAFWLWALTIIWRA
jgi:hypothetical protein